MSDDAIEAVARFLRDVPPLHETEKPVSFDPVQSLFLQKLVRESTLQEGISVAKQDFFAAIACLDYFTDVVAARPTLLADIAVVVEELDRMADYLDPDLELLVRYIGVYIVKDLKGDQLFGKGSLQAITRRHARGNGAVPASGGPADLFDRAAGRFVCDLVRRPEVRDALGRVAGRNDLRAALLIDALLAALPGQPAPAALKEGQLVPALTELLAALTAQAPTWSLHAHVERLRARL